MDLFLNDFDIFDDADLDDADLISDRKYETKTCNRCGKKGLIWAEYEHKWLLHEGGEVHNCEFKFTEWEDAANKAKELKFYVVTPIYENNKKLYKVSKILRKKRTSHGGWNY